MDFHKMCHDLLHGQHFLRGSGVKCTTCGQEVLAYYAEERIYMVSCPNCGCAIVEASNPSEAATKIFGRGIAVETPDGLLRAVPIHDSVYPRIDIYLGQDDTDSVLVSLVEYNDDRNSIFIGAYDSKSDEPIYYEPYFANLEDTYV